MGILTKVFVLIPLIIFAVVIFGFGMYNTICKNSNVDIFGC